MKQFALDRTFSWIDWRQAELVCTHKDVCKLLDEEQLRLYLSIFPGGSSLLEMLCKHDERHQVDNRIDEAKNLENAFKNAS